MFAASREVAGIHGGVDGELPGSMMDAASPVASKKNENVRKLDLGYRSIMEQ